MLPVLYRPAVSYLRVEYDMIFLFPPTVCCVPCSFIIMSYCACSRRGGGLVFLSLNGVKGPSLLVFLRIASLCGVHVVPLI